MTMIPSPGRPPSGSNHPSPEPGLFPMELWRNLRSETAARLQPTPPLGIDADEPVSAAVEAMRTGQVGCLLVTHGGQLVGIFSERDLLTRVLAPGLLLSSPTRQCM